MIAASPRRGQFDRYYTHDRHEPVAELEDEVPAAEPEFKPHAEEPYELSAWATQRHPGVFVPNWAVVATCNITQAIVLNRIVYWFTPRNRGEFLATRPDMKTRIEQVGRPQHYKWHSTFARETGLTVWQVTDAMRALRKAGIVHVESHPVHQRILCLNPDAIRDALAKRNAD